MFSKHVTSLSSAYFHDELTLSENQRVAEHLSSCATCRADFEDVKVGARFAEQLQIKSAPDSVWAGVVAQLDRKNAAIGHRGRNPTPGSPAGQPGWGGAVREGAK